MREIRLLDSLQERSPTGWFSTRWAGAMAAAAALVVGAFVMLKPPVDAPLEPVAKAVAPLEYAEDITVEEFAEELEELAYLGELMMVPDTSLLADEELAALLF